MTRRDFVKTSCKACFVTGGGLMITSLFEGCTSIKVVQTTLSNKVVEVPLSVFEGEENKKIIRVDGMEYDILLCTPTGKDPVAYLLRCTHIDNRITVSNAGFTCNLHGSRYAQDGSVLQGPATVPLTRYRVIQNQNSFQIQLP